MSDISIFGPFVLLVINTNAEFFLLFPPVSVCLHVNCCRRQTFINVGDVEVDVGDVEVDVGDVEEDVGEVEDGVNVSRSLLGKCCCCCCFEDVPPVEFMYLVFTRMPGESYRRRLRSLLLYLCYVFRALINSLVC